MAFQIIDDCLDYSGDEAVVGKSLGTDLRQGKVTLPLIYLLESLEKDQAHVLLEALRQPLTAAMEEQIASQVRERGALRVARERALGYIESARSNLAGMDSEIRDCLDRVAGYVVRRQK
jgi:octaprenyl-diphosphate synthase